MKKNTFLNVSILILLVLTLSLTSISAVADTVGNYNETILTVISPIKDETSPLITIELEKYTDVGLINLTDNPNYINQIQTCYAVGFGFEDKMSYSNDTAARGYFSIDKNFTNGEKNIDIYCYNATMDGIIEQFTENLTYHKLITFNVDYTSIKTCDNLDRINMDLNADYNLVNDIDCASGGPHIGIYRGVFDGGGYNINNYYSSNGAMFYQLYGQIKDLNINNASVVGGLYSSGLVGLTNMGSIIENVKVQGEVKATSQHIGGIVGRNTGTIKNSESNVEINSPTATRVGGIVGENYEGTINNCIFRSKIIGGNMIGGIAGSNLGIINNSHSYGSVEGTGDTVGGINGINWGQIYDSSSNIDIKGVNIIGGVVGSNGDNTHKSPKIISSYALGNITAAGTKSDTVGGVIGSNYAKVSDSYYIKTENTPSNCVGNSTISENETSCWGESTTAALNITVNGNTNFTGYTGYFNFLILGDALKPIMEFNYTIVDGVLTFNDSIVKNGIADKAAGYLIINGLNTSKIFGGTKTIYLDRNNITMTDVCIKDADIDSKNDISLKCDGIDEYIVKCDGIRTADGYTCSLYGTDQYKISGLKHSGVIQTDAVEETPVVNNGGSSGGSSGCLSNWTCSGWGACYDGNQIRTCTNSKPSCSLGTVPNVTQACIVLKNDIADGINLISAADSDTDKQTDNTVDHEAGRGRITLIILGAVGIVLLYWIFHMISNTEAKRLGIKKVPVTKKDK